MLYGVLLSTAYYPIFELSREFRLKRDNKILQCDRVSQLNIFTDVKLLKNMYKPDFSFKETQMRVNLTDLLYNLQDTFNNNFISYSWWPKNLSQGFLENRKKTHSFPQIPKMCQDFSFLQNTILNLSFLVLPVLLRFLVFSRIWVFPQKTLKERRVKDRLSTKPIKAIIKSSDQLT